MTRKFLYLINPVSGTKKKAPLLQLITERTREQGIPFEIMDTRADGDYSFLPNKLLTENISDVIICGGDGSINQVAGALVGCPVNVGIIPMGSGNGLALAAGISKNPSRALDIIFEGTAWHIDGLYINDKFSCMLCGLGFDALVAHEFAQHGSRGLSTYVKLTVKHFFKAKPYRFEVEFNGTNIKTEAFFISIANSNQFGNNFTIAPRASLSDGLLDIVIVNKMNKWKLLYMVLKQIRLGQVQQAGDPGNKSIHYFQTAALTVKNLSMAPLHIDGEPVATNELFKIRISEKAICLLQP